MRARECFQADSPPCQFSNVCALVGEVSRRRAAAAGGWSIRDIRAGQDASCTVLGALVNTGAEFDPDAMVTNLREAHDLPQPDEVIRQV